MEATVRPARFAGSWYPAKAAECERQIAEFLRAAPAAPAAVPHPLGGIVPHAGWVYSGRLACGVIRLLAGAAAPGPRVVALFGMHLSPGSPAVMMPKGAWQTPFGELPVAEELAGELARQFPFELETPRRFSPDNTVELQLPFIKYFFPEARLVAVGAPPAPPATAIGLAVAELARRSGTALTVIGSTDLTHYGPGYGFAPKGSGPAALDWVRQENDRRVIEAMLGLDAERVIAEGLANQNACCPGAAAAAIAAGRALGAASAAAVGYATSHDRSPGESFVGYAGIVFG
jgi:hypothetical protein